MDKRLPLFFLLWIVFSKDLTAQWTKKDSLWLQNVLSGKEKPQLNDATKQVIRDGSFLRLNTPPSSSMRISSSRLPLIKDFSEYIREDTVLRKKVLKDLPSFVFWLYAPPPEEELPVFRSILNELKRNPLIGNPGGLLTFDAGELTSRKAYVHRRNAKRDGTWKNYNNLPTADVLRKKKSYAVACPEKAGRDTLLLRSDTLVNTRDTLPDIPL